MTLVSLGARISGSMVVVGVNVLCVMYLDLIWDYYILRA